MSKLVRVAQKLFGSLAGPTDLSVIGSLNAGAPAFTSDPVAMQSLANFLDGWFGISVASNSPAEEDMNSLFFLAFRQIAYLFQAGIPEWDSSTTYYIGSIAQDGTGGLYVSLVDSNTNVALSNTTNWRSISGGTNVAGFNPASQSPYTVLAADNGKTFLVNSANGASVFNLPTPSANFSFRIKDTGGVLNANTCTMHRHGAELFAGLAADYVMKANGGEWSVITDGTNWFITGR